MAIKHVDLDDCYIPQTNDQNILIDVEQGDGGDGSYSIFLGTRLKGLNKQTSVGTNAQVAGKNIIVSVTIVDELQETNWTSMSVVVQEGTSKKVYGPFKAQAENNNDTVIYTLKLVTQ
ncbi:MAG: hypothetical protein EOP04_09250 [Proteobacteria bacterium]|nr:MAG: hypothetical protein EOP04_09250 [Pseudomonadota bacterium]